MGLTKSHGFLFIASLGFSWILVFSTLLIGYGVSSWEQAFFRLVISLPILLALLRGRVHLPKRDLPHFVSMGFVFSMFLSLGLSTVAFGCPIAVASALLYTQPFFTAIISHITRRERLTLTKLLLVVVGMTGAFLTSGVTFNQLTKLELDQGVVLALLSGFVYALYLYLKRKKGEEYTPLQALFNVVLLSVPCTIIIGLALGVLIENPHVIGFAPPTINQFFLLVMFAVCSTVIPYSSLNHVDPKGVSPTVEGILLLLDPLLASVWGVVIFRQLITFPQYLGIFLILSSAAAALKAESK